jgi:hypothetical protein
MLRLKSEMERVRTLLEMCRNRDKMKKELFLMDKTVFEQRLTLRNWKRLQLVQQRAMEAAGLIPPTIGDILTKVS